MRVHLPGWEGRGARGVEAWLRRVRGVRSVRANSLTGNVLIRFDPTLANDEVILTALRGLDLDSVSSEVGEELALRPAQRERRGRIGRARIAVRRW
jgi:hypothetical protein